MTLKEKVNHSAKVTQFMLYKEGLFYKCYNEDAMVFVQHVKEYKVSHKFVKSVGAAIYSIGFPVRNGSLSYVGFGCFYWSSTVSGTNAWMLDFGSSVAGMSTVIRANGFSVRCLKD